MNLLKRHSVPVRVRRSARQESWGTIRNTLAPSRSHYENRMVSTGLFWGFFLHLVPPSIRFIGWSFPFCQRRHSLNVLTFTAVYSEATNHTRSLSGPRKCHHFLPESVLWWEGGGWPRRRQLGWNLLPRLGHVCKTSEDPKKKRVAGSEFREEWCATDITTIPLQSVEKQSELRGFEMRYGFYSNSWLTWTCDDETKATAQNRSGTAQIEVCIPTTRRDQRTCSSWRLSLFQSWI